ncbi:MAG: hypothetical protein ACI936_003078 [Paraglaciecola sp.]|jgi:hypothetical protein
MGGLVNIEVMRSEASFRFAHSPNTLMFGMLFKLIKQFMGSTIDEVSVKLLFLVGNADAFEFPTTQVSPISR